MRTNDEIHRWLIANKFTPGEQVKNKQPYHHQCGVNVALNVRSGGCECFYDQLPFPITPEAKDKFTRAVILTRRFEKFMGF